MSDTTSTSEQQIQAKTYRKKPVEIKAVQFDGKEETALKLMDWISEGNSVELSCPEHEDHWDGTLIITTLEGDMKVKPGDYVIRGVQGEHYPCKPDIFEQTYEPAVNGS